MSTRMFARTFARMFLREPRVLLEGILLKTCLRNSSDELFQKHLRSCLEEVKEISKEVSKECLKEVFKKVSKEVSKRL